MKNEHTGSSVHLLDTPVGKLALRMQEGVLLKIDFLAQQQRPNRNNQQQFKKLTNQLQQYFRNPQTHFNIKSDERGTAFQQRVWQALRDIPSGETRTYGQIAKQLNSSPRAVGNACRANPLPIITPCHRVTAANGTGGFAGARQGRLPDIKKWLLKHEARPQAQTRLHCSINAGE